MKKNVELTNVVLCLWSSCWMVEFNCFFSMKNMNRKCTLRIWFATAGKNVMKTPCRQSRVISASRTRIYFQGIRKSWWKLIDLTNLTNLTAEMINCNVPLTRVLGKLYDISSGFVPPLFTQRKDCFCPYFSRNQIVQVNMRWKAPAEIYKVHSFAPFSWDPSGWRNIRK